jgi:DNA-binding response OmpR family regulator
MSDAANAAAGQAPTVYFIDDSATMREVIKIAFRKENISVIACHDGASAIAQFSAKKPDCVITDVIMPEKDGYEVCQFVKEHAELSSTPVILMSGVVNRAVAEKAMAVKADELIRKPFQPQELIARVKNLLNPKAGGLFTTTPAPVENIPSPASAVLNQLFASPRVTPPSAGSTGLAPSRPAAVPANGGPLAAGPVQPAPVQARSAPSSAEVLKLRNEVRRLELLVKKLQAELEASRQYCSALESQFETADKSE